jgi:hypothetical protein
MPQFKVLCRVDAFIDYVAEVEADDAEDAAYLAKEGPRLTWRREGEAEFDARVYVTLDGNGAPIESTQRGDF